jgi:hypothetical protein
MKSIVAVALALGCAGCAGEEHGDTFQIVIDPAFSAAQQAQIIAGAGDWLGKIPELSVSSIVIAECFGGQVAGRICFHPIAALPIPAGICGYSHVSSTFEGVTCHPGNGGDIYVWTGVPTFLLAAEHEMGHAMGLSHEGTTNLMSAEYDGFTLGADCNDIAQWYTVRGMVVPLCGNVSTITEVQPSS